MRNGWIINQQGERKHYQDDLLHCEWGPAIFYKSGVEEYWDRGRRHRLDGPAVVAVPGQTTEYWYVNNHLHRTDGPAVTYPSGTCEWFLNNIRHREDGPAVEHADGRTSYYWQGKNITAKEHLQLREMERMKKRAMESFNPYVTTGGKLPSEINMWASGPNTTAFWEPVEDYR